MFSIKDLLSILKMIWYFVYDIFFSWKKRQYKSLVEDIKSNYNELKHDLFQWNPEVKNEEIKTLLGEAYDKVKLEDPEISDLRTMVKTKNLFTTWLSEYMRKWDYAKLLNWLKIKFNSYLSVLVECARNYRADWNENKLKKERNLFDNYIVDNLLELKKAYIDLMITILHPEFNQQQRWYIINETINKIDFEKYIPAVQKFLNNIDGRVI